MFNMFRGYPFLLFTLETAACGHSLQSGVNVMFFSSKRHFYFPWNLNKNFTSPFFLDCHNFSSWFVIFYPT